MTTSLQSISINAEVVTLLQQNRVVEAISCFQNGQDAFPASRSTAGHCRPNSTSAFLDLSRDMRQSPASNESTSSSSTPSLPAHLKRDEKCLLTVGLPPLTNDDLSISPDNVFTIFNRGILYSTIEDPSLLWTDRKTLEHVIFLYNLGLLCHRQGVETGNTKYLRDALSIYDGAYSMISSSMNKSFDMLICILLALINNIGHIHSHLFNVEEARSCRRIILRLLEVAQPLEYFLSDDEYGCLFLNIIFFRNHELLFAPAA